ncbi:MAG: molybdopterin-dependent oxidoreductase, partial [Chloroflexi bacterium]|nr:molybdopterin-dependent oxidoreductase [Chloroflexota bacterium]
RPSVAGSAASDYWPWWTRLANAFGSPNRVSATHICNWHRDSGSSYTYGRGLPWPHFEEAGCVILWGHNPQATWIPHAIRARRAQRRGARLIVIDPRRTGIAGKADLWVPVRPGTDGALALGLIHLMIAEGMYDQAFTRDWTNGPLLVREDTGDFLREADLIPGGAPARYAAWDETTGERVTYDPAALGFHSLGEQDLRPAATPRLSGRDRVRLASGETIAVATAFTLLSDLVAPFTPERVESIAWTPADTVRRAAELIGRHGPVAYYPYNGLEQQSNAMQTNRAVCSLYALTGNYDAPGGNVIFATPPIAGVAGEDLIDPAVRAKRLGLAERPLGPANLYGSVTPPDFYRAVLTGKPYPVRGLMCFGGNMLIASEDAQMGREAFEQLDFYAQTDLFMTPTAEFADIVLPACTFWEASHARPSSWQGPATTNYMQLRKQVIPPLYESRSDMDILFDLAVRLGFGDKFWNGDVEASFNHVLAPTGVRVDDLRANPLGLRAPVTTRYRKYSETDPGTGRPVGFSTPTRRMSLYSEEFKAHGYDPLPVFREPMVSPNSRPDLAKDYPLILINAKTVHFTHGQHRSVPSLRKRHPHPNVQMHPETAAARGVADGDWVYVETFRGRVKVQARVTEAIAPQVVCIQHGWWQACQELGLPGYDAFSPEGANDSRLFNADAIDPISGSVPLRAFLCEVRQAAAPETEGSNA